VAKVATPHEGYHRQYGSFATIPLATDGNYFYASFGSRGIYCYDLGGAHWLVVQSRGTAATASSMTSALAGNPATAHAVRAGKAAIPRSGFGVIPSGSQAA
jgi:hypothetical protein